MYEVLQQHAYLLWAIPILLLSNIVYQRYFSPLAKVPGPFLASITSFWLAHAYWRDDFHRRAIELHKTYGPIVRVGPDAVDVGDPDAVKLIYGAGSKYWKGRFYTHLLEARPGKNLLGVTDRQEHRQLRRFIDPLYTLKALRENEELYHDSIIALADHLRANSGQVIDMAEWMIALAVDAFTGMTYGKRYGMLENHREAREMLFETEKNWSLYVPAVFLSPFLGYLEKKWEYLETFSKIVLKGGRLPLPILEWVGEQVKAGMKTYKQLSETPTLLERTIQVHKEHPKEFDEMAINAHMFEIVFAGFETCGATLPKMMYHIATTEGCQDQLRKELESVRQPHGLDGLTKYDELIQLPYLTACIHEGYRMDPITGTALSRKVPAEGVTMNGYHLPGGIEIGITPWVVSYNEEIMPEPEKFRPERWLEASKEKRQLMERNDLFYGGGPSGCVGKVIASAFLYKTLAVVFSNFTVELVGPKSDIREINIFPVKWRNVKMKLTAIEK